jgi:hypothetical protein
MSVTKWGLTSSLWRLLNQNELGSPFSIYQQKLISIAGSDIVGYYIQDEEAGSAMKDATNTMSDGTYNSVTLADDTSPSGSLCPYYDGISSYAQQNSTDFNSSFNEDEWTVFLWIKRPQTDWSATGSAMLINKDNAGTNLINLIYLSVGGVMTIRMNVRTNGVTATFDMSNPTPLDEYKAITTTYSKSNNRIRVYLGTTLVNTFSAGTWSGTSWTQITMGASDTGTGPQFNNPQNCSDWLIFNREATAGEVVNFNIVP